MQSTATVHISFHSPIHNPIHAWVQSTSPVQSQESMQLFTMHIWKKGPQPYWVTSLDSCFRALSRSQNYPQSLGTRLVIRLVPRPLLSMSQVFRAVAKNGVSRTFFHTFWLFSLLVDFCTKVPKKFLCSMIATTGRNYARCTGKFHIIYAWLVHNSCIVAVFHSIDMGSKRNVNSFQVGLSTVYHLWHQLFLWV